MTAPKNFFIVWNPKGSKPPTFKHESYQSAKDEAKRLALENAGQKFYVLESRYSAHFGLTEEFFPDDIPF